MKSNISYISYSTEVTVIWIRIKRKGQWGNPGW